MKKDKKDESIYKVIHYRPRNACKKDKLLYPTFKVGGDAAIYYQSLDEVERNMQSLANCFRDKDDSFIDTYAYVVLELPLGLEVNDSQYLSVRIYLSNGTLWGKNQYANFFPLPIFDTDEYNYWGKRNQFWGRAPEEIKFKPGDIVEILGYPGNHYWSNDEVNLAIIVKTPPTIEEVAKMREDYFDNNSGFDLCDHALSTKFNYQMDTYEVLSLVCDGLDHAPTISVFKPTKQVSAPQKEALLRLYEKHK